jgi:hypothetical protein
VRPLKVQHKVRSKDRSQVPGQVLT